MLPESIRGLERNPLIRRRHAPLAIYLEDTERSAAMNAFRRRLALLLKSEAGPTATEYAVLIAVISMGVIVALSTFGLHVNNIYLSLAGTVPTGS